MTQLEENSHNLKMDKKKKILSPLMRKGWCVIGGLKKSCLLLGRSMTSLWPVFGGSV